MTGTHHVGPLEPSQGDMDTHRGSVAETRSQHREGGEGLAPHAGGWPRGMTVSGTHLTGVTDTMSPELKGAAGTPGAC